MQTCPEALETPSAVFPRSRCLAEFAKKQNNNQTPLFRWQPTEPLVCAQGPCPVQRASGDWWGPSRGPTGHAFEVSPQQPWGRGLSLKECPRQHRGSGRWGRGRAEVTPQRPGARGAVEEEGEAGAGSPKPRPRSSRPWDRTSPPLPQAAVGLAGPRKPRRPGVSVSVPPGEPPPPPGPRAGAPGELAARAEPSPPRPGDLGRPLGTVGGAQTAGAQVALGLFGARSGSVSEKPLSCFLGRLQPCTHRLPTRGTVTREHVHTHSPRAQGHSLLPPSASPALPPPGRCPLQKLGPGEGEWTRDRAQGRTLLGAEARSEAHAALGPRVTNDPGSQDGGGGGRGRRVSQV